MPQAHSKKATCISDTFIKNCLRLSHFPEPWKDAKIITLPKPSKDQKYPQNLGLMSLFSTMGKLKKKRILNVVQSHNEVRDLLNASQFGFR
jgi:hypothetical protein